jgi:hypothetical protein
MKHVYNYDSDTGELLSERMASLDPEESKLQRRNVYLLPAHATFIQPPKEKAGKIAVFNSEKWSLRTDLRGTVYFEENGGGRKEITKIGKRLPANVTEIDPAMVVDPEWDGKKWIESKFVFHGQKCDTKALVDLSTSERIANLGEGKATTLYLIALGKGETSPEWDAFIEAREEVLAEGERFITENGIV